MRRTPRGAKIAALLAITGLVAAACGSDSGGSSSDSTAAAPASEAPASEAPSSEAPAGSEAPTAAGGMTLTIKLNPDAVWDDGTPITSKDLECTYKASLNTPGSISTSGYDQIASMDVSDPQVAVVKFDKPYAAYKGLFSDRGIIKADAVANCDDISGDMLDNVPFSGTPWKIDAWSPDQLVLVPNENYWVKEDMPKATRVVMVPKADSDTELNSLKSGEVGMIFPQAFAGITDALSDPNIKYTPGYGTNYEDLWFQQLTGPFSDPIFRKAFSMSVDRELILKTIYNPIFPGSELLQCGLWVPTVGKWCQNDQFTNSYDPAGAEKLLTDNGWVKGGDGLWAKDGTAPTIRWAINTGNKRREDTQALMIPDFAAKGFNVVADNTDADTLFQKRLPALDFDLGMFIQTASPDPSVTSIMACEAIPSAENNNQGNSTTGWCNEEASALQTQSDQETDETKRADLIHQIGQKLVDDAVVLPLFQFPNIAAWRTDKIGGPVDADAANFRRTAFNNLNKWEPIGGTEITVGAEQWPDCLNPFTECGNSSWQFWTTNVPVLPTVFVTTADGFQVPSPLVAEEPTVTLG